MRAISKPNWKIVLAAGTTGALAIGGLTLVSASGSTPDIQPVNVTDSRDAVDPSLSSPASSVVTTTLGSTSSLASVDPPPAPAPARAAPTPPPTPAPAPAPQPADSVDSVDSVDSAD